MLQVNSIFFSYDDRQVIEAADFRVEKGAHISIIGESGCGKSTLLKLIYGLYDLDSGEIWYDDQQVLGPKFHLIPGEAYMKYLAQDFDLMPFITVAENVGKFLSNVDRVKKQERIAELLKVVGMTDYASIKAKYLSGGQQQRVALARVLALEPELVLLDEPFSQIDSFRKNALRRNLFRYFKEKEITCIIATHDSSDVLSFSDRVLIMKEGKIVENGIPKLIFEHPETKYIASLFGEVNEIPGYYFGDDNVEILLVYPHQIKITDFSSLKASIKSSFFRGSHYLIETEFKEGILFFENESALNSGEEVYLKISK